MSIPRPRPPVAAVVVVVPAQNEELLVGGSMRALDAARARAVAELCVPVTVVVVLDSCTDGTASIVGAWPHVRVIEVAFASVGPTRAVGVERALAASVVRPEAVWILNTDADSRVPESWILDQVRQADAGADVVVGAIRPDPDDLTDVQHHAWKRRAAHERASGAVSARVHGANLGIRGSSYLTADGFGALAVGEDVALVEAARATGAIVVSVPEPSVQTSARPVGRAPDGYAAFVLAHY